MQTSRILSRLAQAEAREPNPHLACDIRIAWMTVYFAARGDLQPDVGASYAVLGLHPDKVWAAIVERRKALLGPHYAEFWGANLPPKKPVRSVEYWPRPKEDAAREESSSGKSERRGCPSAPLKCFCPDRPRSMAAATATAYRNPGDLKSANSAPPPLSPLVRRILASRLPPRYRVTLKHFIIESQHGPDLWASTFRASKAAEVSYKTMQRHLDWLEREKILHKKHGANEFISGKGLRRPATYVLNGTSAKWLAPRETFEQWQRRNRRLAPSRKRPQRSTSHNSPSNEGAKQEVQAPQPAPVATLQPPPQQQAVATRGDERIQKRRQAIVGSIRHFASKGYAENEAIRSACVACGLARELVDVELKAIHFDFARDSAPVGSDGCAKHPDSGVTQWGTCWGCYSEKFPSEGGCEPAPT